MICRVFAGSKSGPEFAVFAVQNIANLFSTENQYLHYILKGMVEGVCISLGQSSLSMTEQPQRATVLHLPLLPM